MTSDDFNLITSIIKTVYLNHKTIVTYRYIFLNNELLSFSSIQSTDLKTVFISILSFTT